MVDIIGFQENSIHTRRSCTGNHGLRRETTQGQDH